MVFWAFLCKIAFLWYLTSRSYFACLLIASLYTATWPSVSHPRPLNKYAICRHTFSRVSCTGSMVGLVKVLQNNLDNILIQQCMKEFMLLSFPRKMWKQDLPGEIKSWYWCNAALLYSVQCLLYILLNAERSERKAVFNPVLYFQTRNTFQRVWNINYFTSVDSKHLLKL